MMRSLVQRLCGMDSYCVETSGPLFMLTCPRNDRGWHLVGHGQLVATHGEDLLLAPLGCYRTPPCLGAAWRIFGFVSCPGSVAPSWWLPASSWGCSSGGRRTVTCTMPSSRASESQCPHVFTMCSACLGRRSTLPRRSISGTSSIRASVASRLDVKAPG